MVVIKMEKPDSCQLSDFGCWVPARGTLVNLLTNADIDKVVYKGQLKKNCFKGKISIPLLIIADRNNWVTQFIDPYGVNMNKVVEVLNSYQQPFYAFYGNAYREVIYAASGQDFEFIDLRLLCCEHIPGIKIRNIEQVLDTTRHTVRKYLGLPDSSTGHVKGITGPVAMDIYRKFIRTDEYSKKITFLRDLEIFLGNAIKADIHILSELLNRGWHRINYEHERST